MKDIMIDIETFGNGKHACIVQIGACYFDRETGEIGETFKTARPGAKERPHEVAGIAAIRTEILCRL